MQNKSKKILLAVSIIIFLFFCIILFFVYKQTTNNMKTSEESQALLQKEISRREEIKSFNDSFKSIEVDKTLLETHFAQSSDIVPFLNAIEKMASSTGTKAEVSFIEIAPDGSGLLVDMKDTGSFSQVYNLLRLLENSPYELEFTSIEIHNATKGNWEATFKIKLISFI